MKNFELIPFLTPDQLASAAASAWLEEVEAAQRSGQQHCVALSGGRITQKLFTAVVEQTSGREGALQPVHFFWADERCVPPVDVESNFRMAQELLFAPLNIPEQQIHRIRGEYSPDVAAKQAQEELCRIASLNENGQPVFDLIFLGLGEDGHTASLFPGEPEEISNDPATYRAVLNSPKPPPQRVTLGFPAIAAARQVWMLASGQGKQAALRESLSPNGRTPFQRVLRMRSLTTIFSDIAL
ncbi:MAG: 6-phosphogluconolactonase [Akkermansiaceae bacterium]|nr:6-phosphogluconolactonase [Verrucomicrobiales bacterium]